MQPTPADNGTPFAGLSDAVIPLIQPQDGTPDAYVDPVTGAVHVETGDGGVVIDFNPDDKEEKEASDSFNQNLCEFLDSDVVNKIGADLLEGIEADEQSRRQWEQNLTDAMAQLGLQREKRSNIDMDTVSRARHPLLLDAVLDFWANFVAEFLPADGPVKVKSDDAEDPNASDTAETLEEAFNHYLTVTATEYYPDTSRAGFRIGFIGGIVKKVFRCALRQRPVSESIYLEDLIVSNDATDLDNAKRVTHQMQYLGQDVKAMQAAGVWIDVELGQATGSASPVKAKIAEVQGTQADASRPEDKPHTILECHTKYLIEGDKKAKKITDEGLPAPYKITIDKDSRQVLAIYRLWREEDKLFRKRQEFVPWFYAPGLGFYPIGNAQILGNDCAMLTALWREMADAGMFANFPGYLYLDSLGRQDTNRFRIPPAGGQPIKAPPNMRIQDCIMPAPYKDVSPGLFQFAQQIEESARKKAGTVKVPLGEGKTDIPVGSLLTFIEQSTKFVQAVHKGLHTAQKREFELMKELFAEDPEALTKFNDDPQQPKWTKEQLENANISPRSDPNTPSHIHRLSMAIAMFMMATQAPSVFNAQEVANFILHTLRVPDPSRFIAPPQPPQAGPPPPPPDPVKMAEIQQKGQEMQRKAASEALEAQQRNREMQTQSANDAAQLASKERIAQMQNETARLKLAAETQHNTNELALEHASRRHELAVKMAGDHMKMQSQAQKGLDNSGVQA